jgi:hypothetical protein
MSTSIKHCKVTVSEFSNLGIPVTIEILHFGRLNKFAIMMFARYSEV